MLVAHDQSRVMDMENRSSAENGVRLIELHVSWFNGAINESFLYLIRTDDSIGIRGRNYERKERKSIYQSEKTTLSDLLRGKVVEERAKRMVSRTVAIYALLMR